VLELASLRGCEPTSNLQKGAKLAHGFPPFPHLVISTAQLGVPERRPLVDYCEKHVPNADA
jgi:hypothetical protein